MKKILIVFLALLLVVAAALGVVAATFDVNKHRAAIEAALTQKTGHKVTLGGTLHVGVSLAGLTLSAHDVDIGNPAWASRPEMVKIGLFDLSVGLLPLLSHRVDINGLTVSDADILLESASGNLRNWDMGAVKEKTEGAGTSVPKAGGAEAPVTLNIDKLAVKNSLIGVRGVDGKVTVFKVDDLTFGGEGAGVSVHFVGSFNDLPMKLTVRTSADPLMSLVPRPVGLDLTFAHYRMTATGKVDSGSATAEFDNYELTSGDTKISGHLSMAWGGPRPILQGTLSSERLVVDDLKMAGKEDVGVATTAGAPGKEPQRVFSDAPLALDGLKAANVDLAVALADVRTGSADLQNVKGKLAINGGHLSLMPLNMNLGVGTISGHADLDASASPPRFSATFAANDVDLADLVRLGGVGAFLTGKVKGDVNLASSGNSLHELAANLNGPINLIGAGGDVLSTASDKISAGIAEILSPGSGNGNASMNCLVARFIAQNGTVRGNGILVDTASATAAGYGDIDLRSETLNLDFHAKPKLINTGGLLPPLHIGGTLAHPDVGANAHALVNNIGQLLTGGTLQDGVPDVMTKQGQNACAYALDHPSAAVPKASQGGVVQDLAGKAGGLLKGLLGQ